MSGIKVPRVNVAHTKRSSRLLCLRPLCFLLIHCSALSVRPSAPTGCFSSESSHRTSTFFSSPAISMTSLMSATLQKLESALALGDVARQSPSRGNGSRHPRLEVVPRASESRTSSSASASMSTTLRAPRGGTRACAAVGLPRT